MKKLTGIIGVAFLVAACSLFNKDGGENIQIHNQTLVIEVTNPVTGRTWMDRNLGASRAAISMTDYETFGYLYQWGRSSDGHEKRNSQNATILSNNNQTGHGNFILAPQSPFDWRGPQNDNLWQGINGVNNPCPSDYRIPTDLEWEAERQSWSSQNAVGAFASTLKLPMAGNRDAANGQLINHGPSGHVWSSTVIGSYGRFLYFDSVRAHMSHYGYRAVGFSVRCIKE